MLILALFAGEIMLKSGAEIYRVEDTMVRICRACKIDYVECFATTTGIFLSLDSGEDAAMHTFIKRINGCSIDLDKISRVNTFSRVFTTTDLSIEDGMEQLRAIRTQAGYSFLLRLIGAILVGAFYCPMFKGSIGDMFIAGGISGVAYLISSGIARLRFPDFIRILISCMGAAGLVLAAAALGAGDSISPVIIAATTIFMPGVAITNAARDFLSGDMLSGLARFAEAGMSAIAIAVGVGFGIQLWLLGGGHVGADRTVVFGVPWFLLFGFFSTLGFCYLFNVPKKHCLSVSAIGAAGMFAFEAMYGGYGMIAACFFGTCLIAILAEVCSRAGKDATTIFIIPGIIPFVPGALLYETMSSVLVSDYTSAVSTGTEAVLVAGCIAIALVLIATFARLLLALTRKLKTLVGRA
ncbi:MAG: threonine/serine exporter family protein [Clostridiales Family XIII bacterium]|nr:threonine/serine exporter family protein [Clostridiales Family XIII bacterium]